MKKTIVFSVLSALLLFIPISAHAAGMTADPSYVTFGVATPVTFTIDTTVPLAPGFRGSLHASDWSTIFNINPPTESSPDWHFYNYSASEARPIADNAVTHMVFTREVDISSPTIFQFTREGDTETLNLVMNDEPPATPTLVTPTGYPLTSIVSDYGSGQQLAVIQWLRSNAPIGILGIISIALVFFVIRLFRSLIHI